MKSTIISVFLCIAVLVVTFFLVKDFPSFVSGFKSEDDRGEIADEAETHVYESTSREFVIEAAHDVEDLISDLALGKERDFEKKLSEVTLRLDQASETLKNEYSDYIGANWFSKVSTLLQDVVNTPFTSSSDFSTRVSHLLYELRNSYPEEEAAKFSETDPDEPMYYPSFDTAPNGMTSLAMLSIFRIQFQKNTGSILLTFGGNTVFGDTLLGAEKSDSFKNKLEASGNNYPLHNLAPILKNDTISFANLNAPLTEEVTGSSSPEAIKGLPSYASLFKNNGIDIVAISDPSVLSYGQNGRNDTVSALNKASLSFTDEGIVSYQETKLGTVVYLTYNIIDEIAADNDVKFIDAPKQDIAAAKAAGAKLVIVHFNWQTSEPRAWDPCLGQVYTSRAAIDNGADLVIGTHPSSIQSIERYEGKCILYSPGNLFCAGESSDSPFLFQQAFKLDANGNAVPGEILLIPLASTEDSNGPSFLLDKESADAIKSRIKAVSNGLKYGAGKLDGNGNPRKDCIALSELGIIEISNNQ